MQPLGTPATFVGIAAWPQTYEELSRLTRADLVERHSSRTEHFARSAGWYLDELQRRELRDQGDRMEAMTQRIKDMTWALVGLTLLAAVARSSARSR